MEKDYRENQKVIATLQLDDQGQDFTALDVLENGVILGNSPMFSNGRLSLLGIGKANGEDYEDRNEFIERKKSDKTLSKFGKGFLIYFYRTGEKDPLPWEAKSLRYDILREVKVKNADRFIK